MSQIGQMGQMGQYTTIAENLASANLEEKYASTQSNR